MISVLLIKEFYQIQDGIVQRLFDRSKVPVHIVNGTSRWNYWFGNRDGVALIQDNGVRASFESDLQKEAVKTLLLQAELLCAEVGWVF